MEANELKVLRTYNFNFVDFTWFVPTYVSVAQSHTYVWHRSINANFKYMESKTCSAYCFL